MVRRLLVAPALCVVLFGCATYHGMTKQQIADNYFSCVLVEAHRYNDVLTEANVSAAISRCYEERYRYASVLVTEQGIPARFSDFNVSHFIVPLEQQTISTMREAGVIK